MEGADPDQARVAALGQLDGYDGMMAQRMEEVRAGARRKLRQRRDVLERRSRRRVSVQTYERRHESQVKKLAVELLKQEQGFTPSCSGAAGDADEEEDEEETKFWTSRPEDDAEVRARFPGLGDCTARDLILDHAVTQTQISEQMASLLLAQTSHIKKMSLPVAHPQHLLAELWCHYQALSQPNHRVEERTHWATRAAAFSAKDYHVIAYPVATSQDMQDLMGVDRRHG